MQSAADRWVNGPRVARPGDVCVLLEPAEDEIADLRQRQAALQARFGGCPHERVHLTCQRFELQDLHPWVTICSGYRLEFDRARRWRLHLRR